MPKFYSMKVNFLWQTERYCVKLANLKKSLTVKYHEKRIDLFYFILRKYFSLKYLKEKKVR